MNLHVSCLFEHGHDKIVDCILIMKCYLQGWLGNPHTCLSCEVLSCKSGQCAHGKAWWECVSGAWVVSFLKLHGSETEIVKNLDSTSPLNAGDPTHITHMPVQCRVLWLWWNVWHVSVMFFFFANRNLVDLFEDYFKPSLIISIIYFCEEAFKLESLLIWLHSPTLW